MVETAASTFKNRYHERVKANTCVRCRKPKPEGEVRRKCPVCRQDESIWRKTTRKTKNRDIQERQYHMKTWAKRCLTHSRRSDTEGNRPYAEQDYVTEKQLMNLRKIQSNKCYYCQQTMQVVNRRRADGLTVERLVGLQKAHLSDNVVLCCHRCNCKRMGNKADHKAPLQRTYDMWVKYRSTL